MKIGDYKDKDRFLKLFFCLGTAKDLYWSKEALISLVLSILSTVIILMNYQSSLKSDALSLIGLVISGFFAMLGFLIGGLALTIGTLSDDLIRKVDLNGAAKPLMNLIFRFYLIGVVLLFNTINFFFIFLVLIFKFNINKYVWIAWLLGSNYFLFFGLIASVMLMGTNIRILILKSLFLQSK
ncbi:hypothetical protein FO438_04635 [Weissella cibaria]|uniref:Uncharacterized protein n=2 Tax=Weissella cibaria TaxID=137591 RepID=A0A9Q8JHF9_9LACO|nr:hypothetical protein [Weissella cibaria]TVV27241.1 hypothetical protein FO435_04800 [Weissella cibaria]TVV40438.1 hypothetical protein FO438_04635 [Weissella cibaria]